MNNLRLIIESVFQNTPEPFALCDLGGSIIYANPMFTTVFGHSHEDAVSLNISEVLPDYASYIRRIGKSTKGKSTKGIRTKAVKKDGKEIPVKIAVSEYNYAGITYLTVFVRNLEPIETEREKTEELTIELQSAVHELERKNIELTEAQAAEEAARKKAEQFSQLTEEELQREMERNADLKKGEGMRSISIVAVWGILIICLTPGVILVIQILIEWRLVIGGVDIEYDDGKAWDVFENFGIYALGLLGGLLLGFFGQNSFSGSESRTSVRINNNEKDGK